MRWCLTEERLERLLKQQLSWWQALLWHRHVQRCGHCAERLRVLQENERLLAEVRRAIAVSL